MRRPRPLVATALATALTLLALGVASGCGDDDSVPQTGNPPTTAATTTESTADPAITTDSTVDPEGDADTSDTSDTTPDNASATTDVDPATGQVDTSTTDLSGAMTDNLSGGVAIPPPTTAGTVLPPRRDPGGGPRDGPDGEPGSCSDQRPRHPKRHEWCGCRLDSDLIATCPRKASNRQVARM